MFTGVQFTGSLPAGATQQWFTFNWNPAWHVVWYMMPITTSANPELSWEVTVQRSDAVHCTYFITVHNLSSAAITFEGRYAVLA